MITATIMRPSGRVCETRTVSHTAARTIAAAIRGEYRAERGWSPIVRLTDAYGRDVTRLYDR